MAMDTTYLSRDLAALVDGELQPGEQLVWTGQPLPSRFARRSLGLVLFGLPWTAFAVFWIAGASHFKVPDFSHGSGFFPLFGLPFVLIGLGMLTSPLWLRRRARRTVYALTDRRALILGGGGWGSRAVRSFEPEKLRDLRRVQHRDGSGDVIFERTWSNHGRNADQTTDYGFLAVREVKDVEARVRQLAELGKIPL